MKITDILAFYAKHGIAVFPCHYPIVNGTAHCSCGNPTCKDAAKHPYGRHAPRGYKDATNDLSRIDRWWGAGIPYNVGIAAGAVSGTVILDIDPRHDGDRNLAKLEGEHGALPLTWRVLTGGGGEHIYFRHPARHTPNSSGEIASGIDVRGDGGYVVAPPSMHINGRRYAWSVDHHPECTELAPLPEWLAAKISGAGKPKIDWKRFASEPLPEGKRHDSLAKLAGLLFYRLTREPHLAAQLLIAFNKHNCSPPLEEEELLRIIDHAAAREIARRRAG